MGEQYTHAVLRAVVGQLCQPLGFNALQSSTCDVLVYLLKSYLHIVAKTTAGYNIHEANRTEPNLSDLGLAFQDLGVYLCEVSELCRELDSNPCVYMVPKNPDPKESYHVYNGIPSHIMVRRVLSSNDNDEGCIPPLLPQKDTWELEKDLEVSSSEESSPGSMPEPTPCIANVESERVKTGTDEDEEVEDGHGAKVKLHSGQLHIEGWETEEEVIKASPICDADGWLFPCSWEVLPSLEDLEDDLSVGEEAVNMVNRKHLMKHKPTLQGAHGNTLPPPHLVHQCGIGEHGPLYPPALGVSKKKLSKHSRKRELDISEIEPIGKESKKIKIIPQPYSSGSSSDGEDTHQSHDCNAKQRVELKVKLKLDKAVVHTSSAEPPFKSDKKVGSLSKGFSHKTKVKKSKPHKLPAVVSAVTHPSSHEVSDALPPPTVPIGSDYICPQCEQHDDGTPMICCDSCDEWLHWNCVGITQPPPEHMPWLCQSCGSKNLKKSKKKKRNIEWPHPLI